MKAGLTEVSYGLLADLLHLPYGVRISSVAPSPDFMSFTILMVEQDGLSPLGLPEVSDGERYPLGALTVTKTYETVTWTTKEEQWKSSQPKPASPPTK